MNIIIFSSRLIYPIEVSFSTAFSQVGIHPSAAEEFVTMREATRRVPGAGKPKTNL